MITATFDIVQFMAAIDQTRQERSLAWYDVFRDTGVYGDGTACLLHAEQTLPGIGASAESYRQGICGGVT